MGTVEEKAKAYDEAIERARKYMAEGYDVLMPEIFPELAESEDERTRKEILHYILYNAGATMPEEQEHKWVSWLEKQKEKKPAMWKPSEEQMKAFGGYIKDFQERAEAAVGGWNNFDVMIRLYEQLKRIKED